MQGRAEQSKAGQGRAGQGRAEHGRAERGRAWQSRAEQSSFFYLFKYTVSPEPGTRVMINVNVDCVNEVNAITDA